MSAYGGMLVGMVTAMITGLGLWLTFGLPKARLRHRFFEHAMGRAAEGGMGAEPSIFESIDALKRTLANGISGDVRAARVEAAEARRLAGLAATAAATAQQKVAETTSSTERIVKALRAEIDTYTNVAMEDTAHIWESLAQLGIDRRTP